MRPHRTFQRRPTWQAVLAAALLAALALPTGLALTARMHSTAAAVELAGGGREAEPPHEAPAGKETRPRYFVRLVLGRERTTFEGRPVGWGGLPQALRKVPDRALTVLEVAVDSSRVSREAVRDAVALAQRFGFEYGSYVGVHPLGSKGTATQTIPVDGRAAEEARRRLVGLWAGMAIDKPGQGTSRDPLTVELRLAADGRLEGTAYGRFAERDRQNLENVRLWNNRLEFQVAYRAGGFMGLTLEPKEDRLVGEGSPVEAEGDSCDVSLQRVATWLAPPRPIPAAQARPFEGRWSGMAIDKPGTGTSRDGVGIELKIAEGGVLAGTASGRFVNGEKRRVWNVQVQGNRIAFELLHRTGVRMRVSLERKDGRLQGEAAPMDVEEDACDITLRRDGDRPPAAPATF